MARGLSQDQLAELVGCSKMQISGLERGKPKLDVDWMRRLAEPLGVLPADLLSDDDNPWRLNTAERQLLTRYRNADDGQQAQIAQVAEVLAPFKQRA